MTNPIAYTPEDLNEQYIGMLPLLQSITDHIPYIGRPSKAQSDLNRIFDRLKKGIIIDKDSPLEDLKIEELVYLLFDSLNATKMKYYFIGDTAHSSTADVLEIMNLLLPEKKSPFKLSDIQLILTKIKAVESKIESDKSLLMYAKAGLKLLLVIALGYAITLCYYACLASFGLIALSFFSGPLAFLAVGTSISLGLTFGGLGLSAIGAGLKCLKSSVDDIQKTYAARNPTETQLDALDDQNKIFDVLKSKLQDALDKVPNGKNDSRIVLK